MKTIKNDNIQYNPLLSLDFASKQSYEQTVSNINNGHFTFTSTAFNALKNKKHILTSLVETANLNQVKKVVFIALGNTAPNFLDDDLKIISTILTDLQHITFVSIVGARNCTKKGIDDLLKSIESNKVINTLSLSKCSINEDAITYFMKGIKNTALKEILIDNGSINLNQNFLMSLSEAIKYSNLEKTDFLSGKAMTSENFSIIAESLIGSRLQHLNLTTSAMTDESAKILAAVMPFSSITELLVSRDNMSIEGAEVLFNSLAKGKVKKLGLMPPVATVNILDKDKSLFSDEYIIKLASIISSTKLENLSLIGIDCSAKGIMKMFSGILGSSVKYLHTHSSYYKNSSDEEINYVSELLKLTSIEELQGYPVNLTDKQALVFFKSLIGSKVKKLNLNSTKITDLGISNIGPYLKNTLLEDLTILNINVITIKSRDIVAENIYGTHLKSLRIGDSICTKDQLLTHTNKDMILYTAILQNEKFHARIHKFYDYLYERFVLKDTTNFNSFNVRKITDLYSIKEGINPLVTSKVLLLTLVDMGKDLLEYEEKHNFNQEIVKLRSGLNANNINDKLVELHQLEKEYYITPLYLLKNALFKTIGSKLPLNHNIMSVVLNYLNADDVKALIMSNSDNLHKRLFGSKDTISKKSDIEKSYILGQIKGEIKETKNLIKYKVSLNDIFKEMQFLTPDNVLYVQKHSDESNSVILGNLDIDEDII